MEPAQSFTNTVTLDAGTSSGIYPDMTVINNRGLVGRVISATKGSATVLLTVPPAVAACAAGFALAS